MVEKDFEKIKKKMKEFVLYNESSSDSFDLLVDDATSIEELKQAFNAIVYRRSVSFYDGLDIYEMLYKKQ